VGDVDSTLIDDADDCDAEIAPATGRLGRWFSYDSSPALAGTLDPSPGSFQMTSLADGNGCAARVVGEGYPFSDTDGYGFAGIGVSLSTLPGEVCATGYDTTAYSGLRFAALGPGGIRVFIETVATSDAADRPNGYAADLALTSSWEIYEVSFTDLELIDASGGAPAEPDLELLRTIRFEPLDPTGFEFWIDDLSFTGEIYGAGGAGGSAGAGGAGPDAAAGAGGVGPGGAPGGSTGDGGAAGADNGGAATVSGAGASGMG
jgi:hypothetical protein